MAKKLRFHDQVIPDRYLPKVFRTRVQRARAAHYIYLPRRIRLCNDLEAGDTVEFHLTDHGFLVEKVQPITIGGDFKLR